MSQKKLVQLSINRPWVTLLFWSPVKRDSGAVVPLGTRRQSDVVEKTKEAFFFHDSDFRQARAIRHGSDHSGTSAQLAYSAKEGL